MSLCDAACDEQVAVKYSGAGEGRPLPVVLEMVVGPVDRGACVKNLSQYPKEVEYLFLPLSFVSPNGSPRHSIFADGVRVIPVQVDVNLSAPTVEELRGRKRRMHLAAFRFLLGELADELQHVAETKEAKERWASYIRTPSDEEGEEEMEGLIEKIKEEFEAVMNKHCDLDEDKFIDDASFQGLVTEMLDARRWAVSKLRVWIVDDTQHIRHVKGYSLRDAHRKLTAFLERSAKAADSDTEEKRRASALEVCKARGLLRERVDEANEAGEVPLVAAAAYGVATEDIRLLIAAGSAVNGADGKPSKAATAAARYGKVDVLKELLDAKAAINAMSDEVVLDQSLCCCAMML
jgi:hypothetical protein